MLTKISVIHNSFKEHLICEKRRISKLVFDNDTCSITLRDGFLLKQLDKGDCITVHVGIHHNVTYEVITRFTIDGFVLRNSGTQDLRTFLSQ